ncbi:hypothetical protein BKA58DRAFT_379258 [Alternaria rosae]|uniref:uncharacterized protein n=1 Tax=Alternaria rosae TaxID=1187941 RepID=UPI001E8E0042|nr:uncharacterized protein BKA58DRAFT_379258 [Alternaria rosae]KAH6875126.1 hypothetical protein BKA58DRAFT_379258 [Alternaria rosae]
MATDSNTRPYELTVPSAVATPVFQSCPHPQTCNFPNPDLHTPIYAKGTAAHVLILCSQPQISNKQCRRCQGLHQVPFRLLQSKLTSVSEYVSYSALGLLPTTDSSHSAQTTCLQIRNANTSRWASHLHLTSPSQPRSSYNSHPTHATSDIHARMTHLLPPHVTYPTTRLTIRYMVACRATGSSKCTSHLSLPEAPLDTIST